MMVLKLLQILKFSFIYKSNDTDINMASSGHLFLFTEKQKPVKRKSIFFKKYTFLYDGTYL